MLLVLEDQLILTEAPLKIKERGQILFQWKSVSDYIWEKEKGNI